MNSEGKLSRVLACYERASAPVIAQLYASRPDLASEELQSRLADQSLCELPPDEHEAVLLKLKYLNYQVRKAHFPEASHQDFFDETYRLVSARTSSDVAALMQSIVLIELLSHAERSGWMEFPRERMYGLLAGVPTEERDPELWFYIASWAFQHSDVALLEEAYEEFLLRPTVFEDQYPFQRVKLMHRLLTGSLTEGEVADFLQRLTMLPEALEFDRFIWPRIVDAGLATPGLEGLLHSTIGQLRHSAPHLPVASVRAG